MSPCDSVRPPDVPDVIDSSYPDYIPMSELLFSWGRYDGLTFCKMVDEAYNVQAVHWKRNIFKVPSGKWGKDFTHELACLYGNYGQASALGSVALKTAML